MPLLPAAIAFLVGVVLASYLPLPAVGWLTASLTALILAALLHLLIRLKRAPAPLLPLSFSPFLPRTFSLLLLITALTVGAARYQSTRPLLSDPAFLAHYNDTGLNVTITGLLIQPPDARDTYTNLRIQAETIRLETGLDAIPVTGLLLARVDPGPDFHYGDRLTLSGQLQTPPETETFSYRDYLARSGVYSFLPFADASLLQPEQGHPIMGAIFALKTKAHETLRHLYPDPEAALLAGILLGIESGIPADLDQAFRDTGTAHIIAISGFNISIIAALFTSLFSHLFGKKLGALLAILGIAFYTLLVGADAAVVRAALMGSLAIFARQMKQESGDNFAAVGTLAVTAAAMVFANPLLPWDAGFQLSFAATLGLVLFADKLNAAFARFISRYLPLSTVEKITPLVGDLVLLTFAAQITTLPLILYHFQRLSLTAFLANPLILPVQPLVMILGGLTVLVGMIFLPLGQLLAPFAWVFVTYTIRMVELLAKIPGGVIATGQLSLPTIITFYGMLALLVYAGNRQRSWLPVLNRTATLAVLLVLTTLTWHAALTTPDGLLHLTLLDTGMGDALLLETPTGRRLLINGGTSPIRLSDNLGRRLPFGGTLDTLLVTAPDANHLAALPDVVERFVPANVLWAGPTNGNSSARFLQRTLIGLGTPIIPAEPGQTLDLGNGATLRVLTVGKRGAVILLEWDNFRALLPSGLDFDAMDSLQTGRALGPVNVLLLAESGLPALTPPAWITNLNPNLILLSADPGNREGLPSPETLDVVEGYNLLRTDLNGWIEVTTDGERMWVEVENSLVK
ncbi:MAG: ComEC/Rec2 family competence protein [Anaerolineales bacterium]|nr:ComEC/Rec2 family competence protein [Anaerolineales bacterium]